MKIASVSVPGPQGRQAADGGGQLLQDAPALRDYYEWRRGWDKTAHNQGGPTMLASHFLRAVLTAGLAVVASNVAARAQGNFPAHQITMVVPLPAGGTADLLCRIAADKAGGFLGQQIVIENRAGGAGGRVGTESV